MYKKGDFITLKSWEEITNGDMMIKDMFGFSKETWRSLQKTEHKLIDVVSRVFFYNSGLFYIIKDEKRNCYLHIPDRAVKIGYSLSKEEAIKRHRMMWEWMSDQSLEQKRIVSKQEAFEHFGWDKNGIEHCCWCCEYAEQYLKLSNRENLCSHCPLEWPNDRCTNNHNNGYYDEWFKCLYKNDYEKASLVAFEISKLYENMDI